VRGGDRRRGSQPAYGAHGKTSVLWVPELPPADPTSAAQPAVKNPRALKGRYRLATISLVPR
jgi:hypothetical protein